MDFFSINRYTQNDIQALIDAKAEENVHLDFKASGAISNADHAKKEIAKDVSAFANSDGGIIIYGITEENHIASGLSYIDGNVYTKEWLEQVIQSRVQRRIPGIEIYPVRFDHSISQTVYVVKIPRSYEAPHMAEFKYYKRHNFKSQVMEEYEVRDLFYRKNKVRLKIVPPIFEPGHVSRQANLIYRLRCKTTFQISNEGSAIEQSYKNEFYIPTSCFDQAAHVYRTYLSRREGNVSILSIPCSSPVFQGEIASVISFDFVIDAASSNDLKEIPITQKLYYSEGIETATFDLLELEVDYNDISGPCKRRLSEMVFT